MTPHEPPSTGTLAVITCAITILSTAYDYVISATVINRLILQFAARDIDPTDSSWATAIRFAFATLPIAIITAVIASFVPQLDSEVGTESRVYRLVRAPRI